jgi:hypothetical protein
MANQDELDPLAPREAYFEDGYLMNPTLNYFSRKDSVAEEEYFGSVSSEVVKFLEVRNYSAFYVGMVHVGYERSSSVPCVLVIASDYVKQDAEDLISLFHMLQYRILKRLFCFEGTTQSTRSDEDSMGNLAMHQQSPEIGSSISALGRKSSFSIGVYAHFDDDERTSYVISVHPGFSNEEISTTPATVPEICIQQPSVNDFNDNRDELLKSLDLVRDGPTIRTPHTAEYYEELIRKMDNLHLPWGIVHYSEMKVVQYNNKPTRADWSLIKVERQGFDADDLNYIALGLDDTHHQFHPRDRMRVYITGMTDDCVGALVVKRGRTTGTTKGRIRFIYDSVRIEGTRETTSELTIVSTAYLNMFSVREDSGAPVVDQAGRVLGIVFGGSSGEPMELAGHESLGRVRVSYVSPIDLIVDRIHEVTGKTIIIDIPDLERLEAGGTELVHGEFNP